MKPTREEVERRLRDAEKQWRTAQSMELVHQAIGQCEILGWVLRVFYATKGESNREPVAKAEKILGCLMTAEPLHPIGGGYCAMVEDAQLTYVTPTGRVVKVVVEK